MQDLLEKAMKGEEGSEENEDRPLHKKNNKKNMKKKRRNDYDDEDQLSEEEEEEEDYKPRGKKKPLKSNDAPIHPYDPPGDYGDYSMPNAF